MPQSSHFPVSFRNFEERAGTGALSIRIQLNTFPGFMMSFGSSARLSARI